MSTRAILCILGLLLGTSATAAPPAPHPFGWEDMFAMVRLSDPRPSPDGRWVLFTRVQYDVEANRGNTDLGLASIDGKLSKRLTRDPAVDTNGRWLPDGSAVVFLSNRSGSFQIWRASLDGGDPERLTDFPLDVDGFELSPDGKRAVFWCAVFPDCADLACNQKRLADRAADRATGRIYDRLFVRHWDSWADGRRNHLFVTSLPAANGKAPLDLMSGWDQDAPTRPFGGGEEIAWAPDGMSIVFASRPPLNEAWSTNVELYRVPADGKSRPVLLTGDNPATDTRPVFSPDGKTLAYLAMQRPGFEADRLHIVLMDLASGKKNPLTLEWDRSVEDLAWAADGSLLYVTAQEHARQKIFAVGAASGEVKPLCEIGRNFSLALTRGGTLVFLRDRMTHPAEIFELDPATGRVSQVSRENEERLRNIRWSEPEDLWFESDGIRVHAWILRPVDARKGQKVPLAFLIHGGPQGSWLDDFHYRWNPQFYAGAGYAVVAVDFRGSTGYGQAFVDAIRGNWGPGPYADLMAGLKAALQRLPEVDPARMCALGASFGGYMVNWIAGQEHPFACLVTHDGDFDTESSYYNTEELWFPEWEMTGPPWETAEVYARNSPKTFVSRWKTPTLVIQGGLDFRVVETEGLSTFNALQRRGIPSRLLYFPDENHWVLKPQNSRLWHRTVLEWLDRWTKTSRSAPR